MRKFFEIDIPTYRDKRGDLSVFENKIIAGFSIKRVYFIYNTAVDTPRGFHAHKELSQVFICVAGKVAIKLTSGHEKKRVILNQPARGLFVGSLVWREFEFLEKNSVLLVLASRIYDPEDYIDDWDEFLKVIGD